MRQHSLKPGCNNRVTVSRSWTWGVLTWKVEQGGHRHQHRQGTGTSLGALELKGQKSRHQSRFKTCFGGDK